MKKLITLVGILTLAFYYSTAVEYQVVSRSVSKCLKNEKCSETEKSLCGVVIPTDEGGTTVVVGYCITCSGRGLNSCPNSILYDPGSSLDNVDIAQGNILLDYAISEVQTYSNLTGIYHTTVSVSGEQNYRVYQVEWDYSESDEEEDTGTIVVKRVN